MTFPATGWIQFLNDTTSVDDVAPEITKTVTGPQSGVCPPGVGDECWITQSTVINISVVDQGECGISGLDYCIITYTVDGGPIQTEVDEDLNGEASWEYLMTFEEDSVHVLTVTCADIAGNMIEEIETFKVDTEAPETNKTYGCPHYPADINAGAPYPHWITSTTPITLTSADGGEICTIGGVTTYYRDFVVEDDASCWDSSKCNPEYYGIHEEVPFEVYEGPFNKKEESCHIVEFYSVDALGNTELTNYQCVFVDNTPPMAVKDVGEPQVLCDPGDPSNCSYWVRDHVTPITLNCTDQGDHPVNQGELCYKVSLDGANATDQYCDEALEDGWCCVEAPKEIVFEEDSLHGLEFFCIDALGNTEETTDLEYFKVDSQAPIITKTVIGPQVGDCPPEVGQDCWIKDWEFEEGTTIHVEAYDDDTYGCAVDEVLCEWSYELDNVSMSGCSELTPPFNITFYDETVHTLHIVCCDALGNCDTDNETFYVDSSPPETEKTYVGAYKAAPCCVENYEGYCNVSWSSEGYESKEACVKDKVHMNCPQWINLDTEVVLNATDNPDALCAVGVDKIYWMNSLVDDMYCLEPAGCMPEHLYNDSSWVEYSSPFTAVEDSCHMIEYYSVDLLGNKESIKAQCVFVDGTPPVGVKTVGSPSIPLGGGEGCENITYDGAVPEGSGASIVPDTLMAALDPGQSIEEQKTVTTEETPIGKLDVLFLFDLTGSMSFQLSTAKSSSIEIMNNISALVNNSAFGVGSFMDYNGYYDYCGYSGFYGSGIDYPWSLDQNITSNNSAVSSAINDLVLGNGDDGPESYTRALYESQFVGWRPGSRKIVIIFEDNVPHDCNLGFFGCGTTTGVDPGRDAIAGTSDDLNWSNVVADLKAAGISVVAIDSGGYCDSVWEYATNETGGIFSELGSAGDLSEEIVALIGNITSKISYLTLKPKPGFEDWITWTPTSYSDVEGGASVPFNVTVSVPVGQHGGEYHLYVEVVGDGSTLAVQEIWINVSGEPCVPSSDDWFVTQETLITLDCVDPEPHPVGQETVCFKVSFDEDPDGYVTDEYCAYHNGTMTDDECCIYVGDEVFEFNFMEDSVHDLEFYCADHLGNAEETTDLEYFRVDSTPPNTTKTYLGPYYEVNGTEWIDSASRVNLTAVDGGAICHVDNVTTYYRYGRVDDEACWNSTECAIIPGMVILPFTWETYTGPFNISEESCHRIEYYSVDALGNTEDMKAQCVFVDKTPPGVYKGYGKPYFNDGDADWISSETNITMNATDYEPHPSGLKELSYRITLVGDGNCTNNSICQETEGSGGWTTVSENVTSVNIGQQSCHLIEVKAVDNVDKESMLKQCVFVDNSAPEPNKTVGDPKTKWNGQDSIFYPGIKDLCWNGGADEIECWKVTLYTSVSLECVDPEPHPVDHERVCFNAEVDADDYTEEYCEFYAGEYNASGDGFCCLDKVVEEFLFLEETEHNLEYYCVDALGNKGPIDEEKFKVEGVPFEIQINKKWNLVSVPFMLIDDDIKEVLKDVEDSVEAVWTFDAEHQICGEDWCVYTPDGNDGNDNLHQMIPGWGYWVIANKADLLMIGGSEMIPAVTPPSRRLFEGWNLIGYHGTNDLSGYYGPLGNGDRAYCALYTLRSDYGIWPTKWSSLSTYWEPDNPHQWYNYDACSYLDPGAGYWILMDMEDIYARSTACPEELVETMCL
ncbi:MAG: VWA domain-containing protein [Candidatus Altiarchaeota archaeon]|nr:VWA domain-containing protein [Candidatus Altiarchaeota archaeon]